MSSSSCYCCPYGGLTALPAVLAYIANSLAWYAVFHCSFLLVGDSESGFGYLTKEYQYSYYDDNYCEVYTSEEKDALFDTAWKSGKAMGIISASGGIIAFIISTVISCAQVPDVFLKILASFYIFLAIFSLSMLCGLATEFCEWEDCTLGTAAYLAIVAAVLYLGAGVSTCFLRPRTRQASSQAAVATPATAYVSSAPMMSQKPEQATVTETVETINPDGTKTITTTTRVERRPSGGLAELSSSAGHHYYDQ